MILSKAMYEKICRCHDMTHKSMMAQQKVDACLISKGIDIYEIRQNDAGGYVDMIDYARGKIGKKGLEILFTKYQLDAQSEEK